MIGKKDEFTEYQDVKYIRELTEYWNAYMYALINEIYVGVAVNLGMSEKAAYHLAENDPRELKKGFFDNIYKKFKSIFPYKVPKFRITKDLYNGGKPMTADQWKRFNKALSEYWTRQTEKPNEDMTVKAFLFGKKTSLFKKDKIDYKFKSLEHVGSGIPSTIYDAFKSDISRATEKKAISDAMARVAMHVTEAGNGIEEAIRKSITTGIEKGKAPQKLASDMFWDIQVASGSSAQSMRKNWNRIAITEAQSVFEAGILAPHEEEAAASLIGEGKPQYFVFSGGSCKWCRAHQGTVVRLVPASFVKDKDNDSLESMGIKDPYTDIAIWMGKNNVGKYSYKDPAWQVCTPAHPHNVATMQPFDPDTQQYNENTNRIEHKQLYRNKYIPERKDFKFTADEKKERLPHFVSTDRVSYNNHIYERVTHEQYEKKKAEWDKDPRQAIPVDMDSTSYRKIFGEAEKNNDL